ncbi:MAG TPA: fibronectin type III domain-containing protein [Kofleriaceae bacterium]
MAKLVLFAVLVVARVAAAEDECRVVDVDFTPAEKLQIVAWIEDAAGNYVDTAFITQSTGLRGIGNRTGPMDLKSGPRWPYGAREDVLPIWAHRHGLTFPAVVWQGAGDVNYDCNMSRPFAESSQESYFNRPIMPTEPQWDAGSVASTVFTDKGKLSDTLTSVYPPRGDVTRTVGDSADLDQFAALNPFDTISQATPPGDAPARFTWQAPLDLVAGAYVLRVEVSKEFDFNATYAEGTYPTTQCSWLDYGKPYRGQPSVIYDVPFTLGGPDSTASTDGYAGYSDVAGVVYPPDATITTDTPGSGASRLRIAIAPDSTTYRVRVTSRIEQDTIAPAAIGEMTMTNVEPTSAQLTFTAPGDDGNVGMIASYEIRYRIGETLDEASFAAATPLDAITPLPPGQHQVLALDDLRPYTHYVVGIRAIDNCGHAGPLVVASFETPTVEVGCGCSGVGNASGLAICVIVLLLAWWPTRRRRR